MGLSIISRPAGMMPAAMTISALLLARHGWKPVVLEWKPVVLRLELAPSLKWRHRVNRCDKNQIL
jgi:hypothetical protein